MNFLVVSTSLNQRSKSAALAKFAYNLISKEHEVQYIDLREIQLPQCGDEKDYNTPEVKKVYSQIEKADGILLTSPIYNYDVNSAAHNLLELTTRAWVGKKVALAATAGSIRSHMALMPFASSLILHCRCVIIPDFIVAHENSINEDQVVDTDLISRMKHTTQQLIAFTQRLEGCRII